MDNREFAELLLCEATELLTESTRQGREDLNKGIQNSKYWGDKAAKEEAISRKLANKADNLRDQADKEKFYKIGTKKKLRTEADDVELKSGDHAVTASDARYNGKLAKKGKPITECSDLAILLTEAALLLNEED